jgi:hypothetical protein
MNRRLLLLTTMGWIAVGCNPTASSPQPAQNQNRAANDSPNRSGDGIDDLVHAVGKPTTDEPVDQASAQADDIDDIIQSLKKKPSNKSKSSENADASTNSETIERIKKLGGKVEFGDGSSNQTVIGVDFGESAKLTDGDLTCLRDLPELRKLDLHHATITDDGLVHLKGLKKLRELNLQSVLDSDNAKQAIRPMITDAGLVHLKGLTNLRSLNLTMTNVTDKGLTHLAGLAQLRDLDVTLTEVTEAGLARWRRARDSGEVLPTPDSADTADLPKPKSNSNPPSDKVSLPKFYDQLDLTDEQKQKVSKAAKQFDDKIAELKQRMSRDGRLPVGGASMVIAARNAIRKLENQRQQALEEMLTFEQREKLRQLRSDK